MCSDPSIDWHPQESVCWPTATLEWGKRRLQKKHEKTEVGDDELHPLDGVGLWVSQYDFESVADETPGEGDEPE